MDENCAKQPERAPQVNTQISELNDSVNFLEENVSRLESRLSVVSQSEPLSDTEKEEVRTSLVPMAEDIYSNRGRINKVNQRLSSLFERLEVS